MIPVNPNQTERYVPKSERGKENPTAFFYTPLTLAEDEYVQREIGGMHADQEGNFHLSSETARRTRLVLNMGLHGWENFPPGSGENEGFVVKNIGNRTRPGSRQVEPASLDMIPADVRIELVNAITDGSKVDEVAEGNSGPPSE